jgi:regulator of protease activity HflC (stomatin/prohibitin superfamily)
MEPLEPRSNRSQQSKHGNGLFWGIGISAVSLITALIVWGVCVTAVTPSAGEAAVLIKKPILFGTKGVDPVSVTTGRSYVWYTTEYITVNMLPQQHTVHFDDMMTSDGVPLGFDSVIRLQVNDPVALVSNFGTDWYKNNIEAEFSSRVRQAVRKHGMNETAISTEAIDKIDEEIFGAMQKYVADAKIPVRIMRVTVGKANPPDAIKSQRVETAHQEQRINTEKQRKKAEDERKAAEKSRAEADSAYRDSMHMSIEEYLRLESIKMQRETCAKGGCTFVVTDGKVSPTIMTK